jgi:3-hydroxyisobutyrate dehydrogenase
MKAFLGMGLLGSNFTKALIKRGNEVHVWNRTHSKAAELEQYGAKAFINVADAVKGADVIHLTLKDDASVNDVLEKASVNFKPGVIIIDHTTTSKNGAIQRTIDWKQRGFTYQHAPVFMGPPNALEGSGFMLISGDQDIVRSLEPELTTMTGKLLNFGDETGKAAAMKLIGNAFLVAFTASIGDTLALTKALGMDVSDVNTLFSSWNPAGLLIARIKRMSAGDFSNPSWELNMARKDTQLFMNAAQEAGVPLTVIPAVAQLMDEWIGKGHGGDDWTVIGKGAED